MKARSEACTSQNIESAWRGAEYFVRSTIQLPNPERPTTPTEFDIFDRVFVNSSPPSATTLQKANELLNAVIETRTTLNTPVRGYIRKLTTGSEKLQTQSILHQHDANNIRSIVKKRKTRTKGKRVVLKGHFHISMQELHDAVVTAENETKQHARKKVKKRGKAISYEAKSEKDTEEEGKEDIESDIEDSIIVDC
ncbi:hypothetical protein V1524DRAFT_452798 [Lipomyces starkeyi]